MFATCIKVSSDVYTPTNGEPIPMVKCFCDYPGLNDLIKIQIPRSKVEGEPAPGKIFVDFGPKYATGGKLYWKPILVRFCKDGE